MDQTEKFIREVNTALSEYNSDFLLSHVTDDFTWVIVGRKTVGGRNEFSEALDQMKGFPPMKIDIRNIIIRENDVVVEGVVVGRNHNEQKKSFGFCDIYKLTGAQQKMIKKMTSYMIDVSKHKQYREKD